MSLIAQIYEGRRRHALLQSFTLPADMVAEIALNGLYRHPEFAEGQHLLAYVIYWIEAGYV